MSIQETDTSIKKELRAGMNGILSARMREAGMPFRLIFGVELPRLRSIAAEFPQDAELAKHLWKQNIRETRLLAIMLFPPEAFTSEIADTWAESLQTAEEAQILAMILLPKTGNAVNLCINWLQAENALPATSACLCLRHLLIKGIKLNEKERKHIKESMEKLLPSANLHLRKAILAYKQSS